MNEFSSQKDKSRTHTPKIWDILYVLYEWNKLGKLWG